MTHGLARVLAGILALSAAGGCTAPPAGRVLDVEIRWTAHDVPHIKARDYRGLGYGYGYAFAEHRLCDLANHVITIRGERSRWHGPDGQALVGLGRASNLNSDLFYRVQLSDDLVNQAARDLQPQSRALAAGFADGLNRYIADHALNEEPGRCDGAPLPRFRATDVVRAVLATGTIQKAVFLAPHAVGSSWRQATAAAPATWQSPGEAFPGIGSNAWVFGGDVSDTGSAIVVGNPHMVWRDHWLVGHQLHMTIPGEFDAAGMSFLGLPFPVVGFNKDVAWNVVRASTVTYLVWQSVKLDAVPSPPGYVVDSDKRPLAFKSITIDVLQRDGAVVPRSFDIPHTSLGPIYRLPGMAGRPPGWYAITDASQGNARGIDQFLAVARSSSVDELRRAVARYRGLNTHILAGDRHGDALLISSGPMLHIDDDLLGACAVADGPGTFNLFDGTKGICAVRDDTGAPILAPPSYSPAIPTRGAVHSTNNSHKHAIFGQRIEGYSRFFGEETSGFYSLRTNMSERRVREAMADRRISVREAKDIVLDNRSFAAEAWLDQILTVCATSDSSDSSELRQGCAILSAWDRANERDSRGTLFFHVLWPKLHTMPGLYGDRDPGDPFAVRPMRLSAANRTAVAEAIVQTARTLESMGLSGAEPWGDMMKVDTAFGTVRLHGGAGDEGVLSTIRVGELTENGFSEITSGDSYVQVVRWHDGAVVADVYQSHGQTADLDKSSTHEQLRMYAQKRFFRLPFFEEEIERDGILRSKRLSTVD